MEETGRTKQRLLQSLGDSRKSLYVNILREWFTGQVSRKTFDSRIKDLLSSAEISLHNKFLIQLVRTPTAEWPDSNRESKKPPEATTVVGTPTKLDSSKDTKAPVKSEKSTHHKSVSSSHSHRDKKPDAKPSSHSSPNPKSKKAEPKLFLEEGSQYEVFLEKQQLSKDKKSKDHRSRRSSKEKRHEHRDRSTAPSTRRDEKRSHSPKKSSSSKSSSSPRDRRHDHHRSSSKSSSSKDSKRHHDLSDSEQSASKKKRPESESSRDQKDRHRSGKSSPFANPKTPDKSRPSETDRPTSRHDSNRRAEGSPQDSVKSPESTGKSDSVKSKDLSPYEVQDLTPVAINSPENFDDLPSEDPQPGPDQGTPDPDTSPGHDPGDLRDPGSVSSTQDSIHRSANQSKSRSFQELEEFSPVLNLPESFPIPSVLFDPSDFHDPGAVETFDPQEYPAETDKSVTDCRMKISARTPISIRPCMKLIGESTRRLHDSFARNEQSLPGMSSLYQRMVVTAEAFGLQDVDTASVDLLMTALRTQLLRIISAIVDRRAACLRRQIVKSGSTSAAIRPQWPYSDRRSVPRADDFVYSTHYHLDYADVDYDRQKCSLYDLIEVLTNNRTVIRNNHVYTMAFERALAAKQHPSHEELELDCHLRCHRNPALIEG